MVLKKLDIHMGMSKIQPLHQIKNLTHNVSYLLKKKNYKTSRMKHWNKTVTLGNAKCF